LRVGADQETEVLDSSLTLKKVKELSHPHKRKRWLQLERLAPVFPTLPSMPWSLVSRRVKIGVSALTMRILTLTMMMRTLKKLTTKMTSPSMIATLTFGTI